MDRSGNCHLRVHSHVARIQGRRQAARRSTRIKPLRAPAYQVLFALLADSELIHESLRAIAEAAGVSRQAVADAVARLHDEGYLRARGSDRRWTSRPRAPLLERWVEGYQSAVRPRLVHGRFRLPVSGPEAVERHIESLGRDLVFGGTAGAHRLVGHYRGPHTVIHVSPSEELRLALRASPTDRGELVWLWPVGQLGARGTSGSAHPLLVYAELLSDPDPRSRELADRVAEKYLPWR